MPHRILVVALAVALGATSACVQIEGGAVEVSWVVHADGRAITDCSCSDPQIARVRLHLEGRGGAIDGTKPCDGRSQCAFSCGRQTGATPFDIKETQSGEYYDISLIAVDELGQDLPQVRTPDPIARSVVRGQATEVEALLLDTQCRADCEMNKSGICARP
jgi:hypothetical protein